MLAQAQCSAAPERERETKWWCRRAIPHLTHSLLAPHIPIPDPYKHSIQRDLYQISDSRILSNFDAICYRIAGRVIPSNAQQ